MNRRVAALSAMTTLTLACGALVGLGDSPVVHGNGDDGGGADATSDVGSGSPDAAAAIDAEARDSAAPLGDAPDTGADDANAGDADAGSADAGDADVSPTQEMRMRATPMGEMPVRRRHASTFCRHPPDRRRASIRSSSMEPRSRRTAT